MGEHVDSEDRRDWAKSSGGTRGVGDDFVGGYWASRQRSECFCGLLDWLCAEFHIGMFFWRKRPWFPDSQEASNSKEHRKV